MSSEEEVSKDSDKLANAPERGSHPILEPGEIFGEYTVTQRISSGLLTNYYQMQHVTSLEEVTIGIFHGRTLEDPKFLKRLGHVEKSLESFDREGIPQIKKCGQADGHHYILLSRVKGVSLTRFYSEHTKPEESGIGSEETVHVLARILGILGYAHVKGVDHRDLDSNLILIDEDGSVQILGLGIKAAMGRELYDSIVSASVSPLVSNKTVDRLNSFDLISPEYREGKIEDAKVDLYAAGMIGYWLLTSRKVILSNFKLPSEFMSGLPENWNVFFEKTLQRLPEDRFPSCKVALQGLRGMYQGGEIEGGSTSSTVGLIQRQIDRIPVPQAVVDRGTTATRIYRLSLTGLVGLALIALATMAFVEMFNEPAEYRKNVAVKASGNQEPDLILKIQPPVSKVMFRDTDTRFIINNGSLELMVQPGEYELEVTAPNHIKQTLPVTTSRGETQNKRVVLQPQWSELKITTNPRTVLTALNSEGKAIELGVTDAEGVFKLDTGLFSGSYTFLFEKPGYTPLRLPDTQLSYGEAKEIEVEMVPMASKLTVLTEPIGAKVSVNRITLGVTPIRFENLKSGKEYDLLLELEGYRPIHRTVELKPGEDIELNIGELEPKAAALSFDISLKGVDPVDFESIRPDIQAELDGKLYPLDDSKFDQVLEGSHTVRLLHPIYASELIRFEMEDRLNQELDVTMGQLPGELILKVQSEDPATVLLDGEEVRLNGDRLWLPSGRPVVVEVYLKDYIPVQRTFNLKPNERASWTYNPQRIPGPKVSQDWVVPYIGIPFSWVPAGTYEMGSPMSEHGRLPNEGPVTEITFSQGFWAGVYEVTQSHYYQIMGKNPAEFVGSTRPVDSVSWSSAKQFCQRLTEIEAEADRLPTGYVYRLPTEAEWEYLARAGTETPFHFGVTANSNNGNFQGVYPREKLDEFAKTNNYGSTEVGQYSPNAYGLYDVHGNVEEWTLDIYNGRLVGDSLVDPVTRIEGSRVAVRGGSWQNSAVWARSAFRRELNPGTKSSHTGFRVVLAREL